MVCRDHAGGAQLAKGGGQGGEAGRVVQVGHRTTELPAHLGQDRPPEPVRSGAEVDEEQPVTGVQLRGQGAAHVGERGEGRHHERHR